MNALQKVHQHSGEQAGMVEQAPTHPVLHVLSDVIASCSLVQSLCFKLSLAAAVLSRRKFASPIPLNLRAAQAQSFNGQHRT